MLRAGTVAVHTKEGVPRGWWIPSKVLWVHLPETSLCSGGPGHKPPSPHMGPLAAPGSQQPGPNGVRDLAPLWMFGDAPLTFLGAGLGVSHSLHGPA